MAAGYVFTSPHWIFVSLQLTAAFTCQRKSGKVQIYTACIDSCHLRRC